MTDTTSETTIPRFSIDTSLCSGHGRCYTLAPQWFDADDIGYGQVKGESVSPDERVHMEEIVAACPEGAISILDGPPAAETA